MLYEVLFDEEFHGGLTVRFVETKLGTSFFSVLHDLLRKDVIAHRNVFCLILLAFLVSKFLQPLFIHSKKYTVKNSFTLVFFFYHFYH